jgi:2-hydroxy-3-keto-5-methylthiopentenyl-1-phosphate phosphatase
MSTRADFVIAKGSLAEYCRARGQEHAVFTDFDHVKAHLQTWLAASGRVPAKAPRVYSRPPQLPVLET